MSLAIYKPGQALAVLKKCNTPAKCMDSSTPALAEIKKEKGEEAALITIEAWILDLTDFLNISRPMNHGQIRQTAVLIMGDFYYLNIADINLIFTRAKKGYFGELYGSLDGSKIYQWFQQYDNERASIAYNEALKQHDIIKSKE